MPEKIAGIRVRRLVLESVESRSQPYAVNFVVPGPVVAWRPLSIIAGPSQTGKTSIIDFVLYCLGASEHPQHPEILSRIRSAMLECELGGEVYTIERSAVGVPSTFASVWTGSIEDVRGGAATETRKPIEPTSDPLGLSQFVLGSCDLNGVALPEAPTQSESRTHVLSIRDVYRVFSLPNERLDNKNLAFEHSNYMVGQKFRQTIESIFEVDDQESANRAARIKALAEDVRRATDQSDSLKRIVYDEYPGGSLTLEMSLADAEADLARLVPEVQQLDGQQLEQEKNSAGMRRSLAQAQVAAQAATLRVRNRESLLARLASLRGQYADDKRKLIFLKEAERFFDPLHVAVCPACLSTLTESPSLDDGHCSMCGSTVEPTVPTNGLATAATETGEDIDGASDEHTAAAAYLTLETVEVLNDGASLLEAELRATSARLTDLNDYWSRLQSDLRELKHLQARAIEEVRELEQQLNSIADLPAPFLAARDNLRRQITDAELRKQAAEAGLRFWSRVEQADVAIARLSAQLRILREEQRTTTSRPDRDAVVTKLSRRFGEILADFGYPKLANPFIDGRLLPHVRDLPYVAASSGGRVLISLAYYLALWQVAYEESPGRAPGLLIVDSPQKNLGHSASRDDADFADSRLVQNFYGSVGRWLAGDGVGAQMIVVDNSPPDLVSEDVVVRFTRDRSVYPYGLVTDAVD